MVTLETGRMVFILQNTHTAKLKISWFDQKNRMLTNKDNWDHIGFCGLEMYMSL